MDGLEVGVFTAREDGVDGPGHLGKCVVENGQGRARRTRQVLEKVDGEGKDWAFCQGDEQTFSKRGKKEGLTCPGKFNLAIQVGWLVNQNIPGCAAPAAWPCRPSRRRQTHGEEAAPRPAPCTCPSRRLSRCRDFSMD